MKLKKIVQVVADKLDPEANIIWGTQIDESLQNIVRTTVVVSGIKANYSMDDFEEEDFDDMEDVAGEEKDELDDFIDGVF